MKPLVPVLVFGTAAMAALAGCGSSTSGSGSGGPTGSASGVIASSSGGSSTTTATGSRTGTPSAAATSTSATGGGGNGGGGSSNAPAITVFTIKCIVTSYQDLPGMPHTPMYQPQLTWNVAHATGLALSIDDPGVGSYGTYGPSGTLTLGSGCYTDEGSHTVTGYSIGGSGQRAQRTIHENGTMTRPSAPPFGNSTPTSSKTS